MPANKTPTSRTSQRGPVRRERDRRDPREKARVSSAASSALMLREREFEAVSLELVPPVRDRLHARLIAMGVAQEKSVSFLAGMTHRAPQSVRRWFDANDPGLPDLESFARLCVGLGCSADAMLGLQHDKDHQPGRCSQLIQVAESVQSMTDSLTRGGSLGVPMRVPGDEMAPRLKFGDLVFVDTTVTRLLGNGIYALSCNDALIIRRVEMRLGKGAILKCDNKAYADDEWPAATPGRRRGVKVLGKVQGAISAQLF